MVWYVALVAILNLGLGYALAVYLGAGRKHPTSTPVDADTSLDSPELAAEYFDNPPAAEPEEPVASAPLAAEEMPAAVDTPPSPDIDQATGLTTRDHVERRLADMTLAHADLQPMTVALVEVDQAVHGAESIDDRLLRGVAETVREMLTDAHTAARYSDQQFLLLLPHDDLQHATQRTEQVRQRIEATQFVADGQQIQATVTCALAQVAASHSVSNLLEFLEETLDEAKRYGGNRTFMHDGTSPTPVVPPELNFAPQTCAI
jgi:diguanylate cyclase (GGDEF)-like protein